MFKTIKLLFHKKNKDIRKRVNQARKIITIKKRIRKH